MITRLSRTRLAAPLALAVLLACAGPQPGCVTPPPSIQTPQAQLAYRLEDAIDGIARLQTTTIQAQKAALIAATTMRDVVRGTMAALRVIGTAIDNGGDPKAAYKDAARILREVQALLPAADRAKLETAFAAALLVLTIMGG